MKELTLNGEWTAKHISCPTKENLVSGTIKAQVPGDIYADLLRNKLIPNPYYRINEEELQWIGESNWEYLREFIVDEELLDNKNILLTLEGLDTFATVIINGTEIAKTNNMFRSYEYDIKELIKEGKNSIKVEFTSVLPYMRAEQEKRPLTSTGIWEGFDGNWDIYIPHKVKVPHGWVRKEQCNFGWDWGPKVLTCGIWKNIKIVGYNTSKITELFITQKHEENKVLLNSKVNLDHYKNGIYGQLSVMFDNEVITTEKISFNSETSEVELAIDNPQLWWPNGLGDQPLYHIELELYNENDELLDDKSQRIGLREIELVRTRDEYGESFFYTVNGKSIFAKGTNWIPTDGIFANIKDETYYEILLAAKSANMNMIRVWGGGVYEKDLFYDICDELGLLIWQDLMFACSTYPIFDDSFIENVTHELEDNFKRIRHHACMAMICGNNELEQCGFVSDEWTDKTMSLKDYKKVFEGVFPKVLEKVAPNITYWPGSPYTPLGNRDDFNNASSGDSHLWDVWHGMKPFEWYRTTENRFVSEFGFQSFTEPKTTYSYTEPEDRNISSDVMEHHQKSQIGNSTIMHYMLSWFKLPNNFDNTLWVSQILQGLAIKYAIEHWRRNMPKSMGSIIWQLNDTWPGPSWSSIDYFGRWKALHYAAKKFYAPLLISGVEKSNEKEVEVHITNDFHHEVELEARVKISKTNGDTLLEHSSMHTISPMSSQKVEDLKLSKIFTEHSSKEVLIWLELYYEGNLVSSNFVHFERPKHLKLQKSEISKKVTDLGDNQFEVELESNVPALWVWLEIEDDDAYYEDNFFHINNGKVTILVSPKKETTAKELSKKLMVKSLVDTY